MTRLEQLRLLDIERIEMSLAVLAGYWPSVRNDVLLDEPFGWLRAARAGSPEAYCVACGGLLGIFLGFGLDWRHFRRGAGDGMAGADGGGGGMADGGAMYDAGHAATIGWRYVAAA